MHAHIETETETETKIKLWGVALLGCALNCKTQEWVGDGWLWRRGEG